MCVCACECEQEMFVNSSETFVFESFVFTAWGCARLREMCRVAGELGILGMNIGIIGFETFKNPLGLVEAFV